MSGCPTKDSVPADPSTEDLTAFRRRFSSESELLKQRNGEPLIAASSVQIQPYKPTATRSRNLTVNPHLTQPHAHAHPPAVVMLLQMVHGIHAPLEAYR